MLFILVFIICFILCYLFLSSRQAGKDKEFNKKLGNFRN